MKCPVCPADNIAPGERKCPNCGTDLTAILKVNELAAAEFNDALALAQAGAVDGALLRAAAAAALDERFTAARVLLGKLLWRKNQFAEAVDQWQEALALDPDNRDVKQLLASARGKMRRRSLLGAARAVGAVFAFAAVLVVAVVVSAQYVGARPAQSGPNRSDADDWRAFYGHSDAEYDQLKASLSDVNTKLTAANAELAAARTDLASGLAARNEMSRSFQSQLQQLAENHGRERAELSRANDSAAAAIESLRQELRLTLSRAQARDRDTRDSLAYVLELLRPAGADKLSERIKTLQKELGELSAQEAKYKDRPYLFDQIKLSRARKGLAACRRELDACQAEYEARVAPWERGMALLKTQAPAETDPAGKTSGADPGGVRTQ